MKGCSRCDDLNVMRQNKLKNFEGKNGAITNKNAQKIEGLSLLT